MIIALPDSKRGIGIDFGQNRPCAFQVKVLLAIREDAAALYLGAKGGKVNVTAVVNDVLDTLVAHRNKVFCHRLSCNFSVKLFHLLHGELGVCNGCAVLGKEHFT